MKRLLTLFALACALVLAATAPAIGNDVAEGRAAAARLRRHRPRRPHRRPQRHPSRSPPSRPRPTPARPRLRRRAAAPPAPTEPQLVAVDKISSGDTAWMLTSTALVLLMTIPGLALFYGGMVRKKSVLATLMQSFAITCLVTVLWVVIGYSLAFMPGGDFVGSLNRLFLKGMLFQKEAGKVTVSHLGLTVPESVYMTFQMTFAIITPALICGAFADRMKFSAMLWFMGIWSVVIYSPIAHMMWEPSGLLGDQGRARFRRRHGRAHQRGHRRAGVRARAGQAASATARRRWRRTTSR